MQEFIKDIDYIRDRVSRVLPNHQKLSTGEIETFWNLLPITNFQYMNAPRRIFLCCLYYRMCEVRDNTSYFNYIDAILDSRGDVNIRTEYNRTNFNMYYLVIMALLDRAIFAYSF